MNLNRKLLLTRPRHDALLEHLFYWCDEIVLSAKNHGIIVLDCKKEEANKETVSNYLKKQSPNLVIFNGHGDNNAVCGHHNKELIRIKHNEHLLKLKIVYAIACKTAFGLGKESVRKGCKAFIGYDQDFGVVLDNTRICSPTKDNYAKPFKKASNAVSLSLIKGNTAQTAYDKSQKTYSDLIRKYSISTSNKEDKEIRFWLFWDKYFQRIIGEKTATI